MLSLFTGTPELTRHASGDARGAVQQAVEQVSTATRRRSSRQGVPSVEEEPRHPLAARWRHRAALAAAGVCVVRARAHVLRCGPRLRQRPVLPLIWRSTARQKRIERKSRLNVLETPIRVVALQRRKRWWQRCTQSGRNGRRERRR